MKYLPSSNLYATDPLPDRLVRWFENTVIALRDGYCAAFKMWGTAMLGGLAICLVFAGFAEFKSAPHHWYIALPSIVVGIGFFLSEKIRRFGLAAFGLGIVWFIIVTAGLIPFLDIQQRVESPVLKLALAALYVTPPLFGAILLIRRRKA